VPESRRGSVLDIGVGGGRTVEPLGPRNLIRGRKGIPLDSQKVESALD
jgi:hypothetical protein